MIVTYRRVEEFSQFQNEFWRWGRQDRFTEAGLKALYEHLQECSRGLKQELDVIALCCDYTEYDSIAEYNQECGTDYKSWDDVQTDASVAMFGTAAIATQPYFY